jgi:hypothetical protein
MCERRSPRRMPKSLPLPRKLMRAKYVMSFMLASPKFLLPAGLATLPSHPQEY